VSAKESSGGSVLSGCGKGLTAYLPELRGQIDDGIHHGEGDGSSPKERGPELRTGTGIGPNGRGIVVARSNDHPEAKRPHDPALASAGSLPRMPTRALGPARHSLRTRGQSVPFPQPFWLPPRFSFCVPGRGVNNLRPVGLARRLYCQGSFLSRVQSCCRPWATFRSPRPRVFLVLGDQRVSCILALPRKLVLGWSTEAWR
jgi:hypothetical protein